MANEGQGASLNLKLQAEDLQVTGLSIVDGRLELAISARLDLSALNSQLVAQLLAQTAVTPAQPEPAASLLPAGQEQPVALYPDRSVPEFPDGDEIDQPFPERMDEDTYGDDVVPSALVGRKYEELSADEEARLRFDADEVQEQAEPASLVEDTTLEPEEAEYTADPEEVAQMLDAAEFACAPVAEDDSDGECGVCSAEDVSAPESAETLDGGLFAEAAEQTEFPEISEEEEALLAHPAGIGAAADGSAAVQPEVDAQAGVGADEEPTPPEEETDDYDGAFGAQVKADARYGEPQPDIEWSPLLGDAPQALIGPANPPGSGWERETPVPVPDACGPEFLDPLLHTAAAADDIPPDEPEDFASQRSSADFDDNYADEYESDAPNLSEVVPASSLAEAAGAVAALSNPQAGGAPDLSGADDCAEFFAPSADSTPAPTASVSSGAASGEVDSQADQSAALREAPHDNVAHLPAGGTIPPAPEPSGVFTGQTPYSSPAYLAAMQGENPAQPQSAQRKSRIKYVCPKCHTPGHQDIDCLGSIVTCSNCGRAMRLTMRK